MSKNLSIGLFWSVIEILIKRLIDLAVRLVLARLLFPQDFGLVGMAMVFTTFLLILNDGGMSLAIIQKKEDSLTNKHLSTAFWTSFFWSILVYIIIFLFISPLVAKFYNEPRLELIVSVLSFSIIFSSLNSVHIAQLMKAMEFKKLAYIKNITTISSGIIAIILAFFDFGVWALVFYSVLASFFGVPLYYRATKFIPKLLWDKLIFKEIFGFGVYTTTTRLTKNFASNVDYLLIGKFIGASAVGVYTLAYMVTSSIKAQISAMLNRVLFPFYSQMQDDKEKMVNYYLKLVKLYGLLLYPVMLTLIYFGDLLIPFAFGAKWYEAIEPTKILAIAMLISVMTSGYNILIRSVGKPKLEMQIEIITSYFINVPAIIIGMNLYGIIGVAWAVVFSSSINFLIASYILKKHFNLNIFLVIKSLLPVFGASFGFLVVASVCKFFNFYEFISLLSSLIAYTTVSFFLLKDEKVYIMNVLKKIKKNE